MGTRETVQRGHFGSPVVSPDLQQRDSFQAGPANLRHGEMGKKVGQGCHLVVKCIICFLAFNNLVTCNFTIFFNSQVVKAKTPNVEKENSNTKTQVPPNSNVLSVNSSSEKPKNRPGKTGSVNLGSFFTSYMVTTLLIPTVIVFSLNATFGHLQTTAPRLFASRAVVVLLLVVQLVAIKVN